MWSGCGQSWSLRCLGSTDAGQGDDATSLLALTVPADGLAAVDGRWPLQVMASCGGDLNRNLYTNYPSRSNDKPAGDL